MLAWTALTPRTRGNARDNTPPQTGEGEKKTKPTLDEYHTRARKNKLEHEKSEANKAKNTRRERNEERRGAGEAVLPGISPCGSLAAHSCGRFEPTSCAGRAAARPTPVPPLLVPARAPASSLNPIVAGSTKLAVRGVVGGALDGGGGVTAVCCWLASPLPPAVPAELLLVEAPPIDAAAAAAIAAAWACL